MNGPRHVWIARDGEKGSPEIMYQTQPEYDSFGKIWICPNGRQYQSVPLIKGVGMKRGECKRFELSEVKQ